MISLVEELSRKNYAYETPKAVYFDVTKFKKYGRLSGQSLKEKTKAARKEVIDDPDKKNAADFALWFKRVGRFENHLQHWPSPWGEGFPGWHIECSAISRKFLGQPFDIHTGGVDHVGTHHENEMAQSEAAYGKPLARIWMHGEFLIIDKKRMGKSEKNFITLEDVEKKGYDPLSYRYLTLTTHYRQRMNFTWNALESAEKGLKNLRNAYIQIRNEGRKKPYKKTSFKKFLALKKKFKDALDDDLKIPKALAVTWETIRDKSLSAREKTTLVGLFDEVLGLNLQRFASQRSKTALPTRIKALIKERELYRVNKQFSQADALRKRIRVLGYEIEDTPLGPIVLKTTSHKSQITNTDGKNKPKSTAARPGS
jgi:cysteinyl-tRNA synthetase